VTSPAAVRWGTESGVGELLGARTSSIKAERRTLFQYYRSIAHALSVFRTYFGPTNRAFQMIDTASQELLH
jgi:hypothetical protein